MSSLNVIALVSGGKDSFFSILHCLAAGHTVVALANLYPPTPSDGSEHDDLNSFMYQTVGHAVLPLYAQVTGIPIFRQEILGAAVNSERDYAAPAVHLGLDETESLVPLLDKIKAAIPAADAISTGAILSTYQRTRVESVAVRLGLIPLSFLWQYPVLSPYSQSALLHDMRAVGQDSRIIKVASGGLDESFLWENVSDSKTIARLGKAMARFCENGDGAVLGEGGEFETLAIDGPACLWKKRIEIEPDRIIRGEGGEAIWQGGSARVVDKERSGAGLEALRRPGLWDAEFEDARIKLQEASRSAQQTQFEPEPIVSAAMCASDLTNQHDTGNWTMTLSSQTRSTDDCAPLDPASQLQAILDSIIDTLAREDLDATCILCTTLLLRDMSDFAAVNQIYGPFFTTPNPPSRVTVACGNRLPPGVHVMLSVVAAKRIPTSALNDNMYRIPVRKGLHVQSRSYWAPANIGPYSQAVTTPIIDERGSDSGAEIVHVAGQIPLVPWSMELYHESGFQGQALLSLQHLFRIGRSMRVARWVAGVAFISQCPKEETRRRVHTAQAAWNTIHQAFLPSAQTEAVSSDDDEDALPLDAWDRQNRHGAALFDDHTERAALPNAQVMTDPENIPPVFVVQVAQLPRDSPIEWSSMGIACTEFQSIHSRLASKSAAVYHTDVQGTHSRFVAVEVDDDWEHEQMTAVRTGGWEHCTLYAGPDFPDHWGSLKGVSVIPCQGVWGALGTRIRGALVGRVARLDASTCLT